MSTVRQALLMARDTALILRPRLNAIYAKDMEVVAAKCDVALADLAAITESLSDCVEALQGLDATDDYIARAKAALAKAGAA